MQSSLNNCQDNYLLSTLFLLCMKKFQLLNIVYSCVISFIFRTLVLITLHLLFTLSKNKIAVRLVPHEIKLAKLLSTQSVLLKIILLLVYILFQYQVLYVEEYIHLQCYLDYHLYYQYYYQYISLTHFQTLLYLHLKGLQYILSRL